MVADGRRVSGLRLREEMGLQCAGERYAGARSGWVEGSGLCWRAFKCGESGRGRRGGTLTILLASEGAGSGHGVLLLAVHGGAGRGGRREHLSLRHGFRTNFRGSTTRENGKRDLVWTHTVVRAAGGYGVRTITMRCGHTTRSRTITCTPFTIYVQGLLPLGH